MAKNRIITVQNNDISVINHLGNDYISLTDMIKNEESNDLIRNWMRNRNTIEYLGAWEQLYNPDFKGVEFDTFRTMAGLNSFNMTPRKWIDSTGAVGIISKAGQGGGTFAHKDIAFNFGMWISPIFQLYVVTEYQRLVNIEHNGYNLEWDVRRLLSKANYSIHTDAVAKYIIPKSSLPLSKQGIEYAQEAEILNLALYGYTSKDWKEANPGLANIKNMRDFSSINELLVMSNMESMNAEMIKLNTPKQQRFLLLQKMAKEQLEQFAKIDLMKSLRKKDETTYIDAHDLTPDQIIEESKKSILEANKQNLSEFNKRLKQAADFDPNADKNKKN